MTVERPALSAVQRLQDRIAQEAKDKKAASKAGQAEAQGLTRQALIMRERRARPDVKEKERLAIKAKDTAMRRLSKAHPEEFLRLEQEERANLGLPVLVPRKRRASATPSTPTDPHHAPRKATRPPQRKAVRLPAETVAPEKVLVPSTQEEQAVCKHNEGLRKLSYGTFCILCGKRIR